MHRNLSILASLSVVVLASISTACSSSSGGSGGSGSSSGSSSTPVSFMSDVMPAFQQGCTLTMECHGQTGNPGEENLFLGNNEAMGTPVDPAVAKMVYNGLVNVMAAEQPSLALVKPGDATNSYLIQKLNDTQNSPANMTACAAAPMSCTKVSGTCTPAMPCGGSMPSSGTLWSADNPTALAAVTNWVMQGALNN